KNDSRKLFQRLWTDEDEIVILQGFLDYNANRGSSYHNDTGSFYDQIKSKIQLDFNKSQLVDKLRRLKKKYRNVLQKFDSAHMTTPVKNELITEKKTASRKRSRTTTDEKRELNDSLGLNKDNHNNSANNNSSNVDDENGDKS
ncbi:mediator-associated protein 1-like, partial [Trifolium medium]|nr:mediator-associated protein 1-like [Trifolium medium]